MLRTIRFPSRNSVFLPFYALPFHDNSPISTGIPTTALLLIPSIPARLLLLRISTILLLWRRVLRLLVLLLLILLLLMMAMMAVLTWIT